MPILVISYGPNGPILVHGLLALFGPKFWSSLSLLGTLKMAHSLSLSRDFFALYCVPSLSGEPPPTLC